MYGKIKRAMDLGVAIRLGNLSKKSTFLPNPSDSPSIAASPNQLNLFDTHKGAINTEAIELLQKLRSQNPNFENLLDDRTRQAFNQLVFASKKIPLIEKVGAEPDIPTNLTFVSSLGLGLLSVYQAFSGAYSVYSIAATLGLSSYLLYKSPLFVALTQPQFKGKYLQQANLLPDGRVEVLTAGSSDPFVVQKSQIRHGASNGQQFLRINNNRYYLSKQYRVNLSKLTSAV